LKNLTSREYGRNCIEKIEFSTFYSVKPQKEQWQEPQSSTKKIFSKIQVKGYFLQNGNSAKFVFCFAHTIYNYTLLWAKAMFSERLGISLQDML
jgi:hypothetical protein